VWYGHGQVVSAEIQTEDKPGSGEKDVDGEPKAATLYYMRSKKRGVSGEKLPSGEGRGAAR